MASPASPKSRPKLTPAIRRRAFSGWLKSLRLAPPTAGEESQRNASSDLGRQAEAFQKLTIADVRIPRADIRAVELATPFTEVVAAFASSEHSRLPVYRRTLDDPVGLVHLKDVFGLLAADSDSVEPAARTLARLKRPTLYVPPSMRAADLLLRMQATRIHMAMVIDEFGGVDGLVTLEDVIEAVVGDIDDEHDETELGQIVARPGGIFDVDARADLRDLEEALGVCFPQPDDAEAPETVAGLLMSQLGRLPERGEVIVHPSGYEFEVIEADPRRIKRLRLRPTPAPGI